MKSEWNSYTLSDITNIIGGGTPKRAISEYWNGEIPWLSVVDFNTGNRHVSETKETITDLGLQKSSTKLLDSGQLIISARGTVGALAQLDKPMAFNQSCYGLDAKGEYTTNDYLYYLVKKKVRDLQQITHGAVFDTITRDTFKQIDVQLPPLPTQKKIAHILSTLDDKIELNRKMNQTLEEMAQALFKSWFIEKVGDEWEECKLSDVLEIKYGKDHKKLADGNIPVYGSGGVMRYADNFLYDKESILIPRKGTLTNLFYIDEPFWTVDTIFWSKINTEKVSGKFLFFFLKTIDLSNLNVGSAVPSLTTKVLNEIKISIPTIEEQKEFNEYADSAWEKMRSNSKQIKTLEEMRDTLLPKLLSGELDVSKLHVEVES